MEIAWLPSWKFFRLLRFALLIIISAHFTFVDPTIAGTPGAPGDQGSGLNANPDSNSGGASQQATPQQKITAQQTQTQATPVAQGIGRSLGSQMQPNTDVRSPANQLLQAQAVSTAGLTDAMIKNLQDTKAITPQQADQMRMGLGMQALAAANNAVATSPDSSAGSARRTQNQTQPAGTSFTAPPNNGNIGVNPSFQSASGVPSGGQSVVGAIPTQGNQVAQPSNLSEAIANAEKTPYGAGAVVLTPNQITGQTAQQPNAQNIQDLRTAQATKSQTQGSTMDQFLDTVSAGPGGNAPSDNANKEKAAVALNNTSHASKSGHTTKIPSADENGSAKPLILVGNNPRNTDEGTQMTPPPISSKTENPKAREIASAPIEQSPPKSNPMRSNWPLWTTVLFLVIAIGVGLFIRLSHIRSRAMSAILLDLNALRQSNALLAAEIQKYLKAQSVTEGAPKQNTDSKSRDTRWPMISFDSKRQHWYASVRDAQSRVLKEWGPIVEGGVVMGRTLKGKDPKRRYKLMDDGIAVPTGEKLGCYFSCKNDVADPPQWPSRPSSKESRDLSSITKVSPSKRRGSREDFS